MVTKEAIGVISGNVDIDVSSIDDVKANWPVLTLILLVMVLKRGVLLVLTKSY